MPATRGRLLDLLEPVSRAADRLDWLKEIVDAGEIFHPLRWTPKDAVRFLRDVEAMEQAGLIVRMPASWRMNRPSHPNVEATVGSETPSMTGVAALLDFDLRVSLDGETLTAEEIEELLGTTEGLALLRGKWVEIDRERLKATLDQFKAVERLARKEGLTLRTGHATARRRRFGRCDPRCGRRQMGARRGRAVASQDAGRLPGSAGAGRGRLGRGAEGGAAALPESRSALARLSDPASARRVPRRRHGARQDHPGAQPYC